MKKKIKKIIFDILFDIFFISGIYLLVSFTLIKSYNFDKNIADGIAYIVLIIIYSNAIFNKINRK